MCMLNSVGQKTDPWGILPGQGWLEAMIEHFNLITLLEMTVRLVAITLSLRLTTIMPASPPHYQTKVGKGLAVF